MTKEEKRRKKNLTTDMDDTVQCVYLFRIFSNTFEQLSNAQFQCSVLSLSLAIHAYIGPNAVWFFIFRF